MFGLHPFLAETQVFTFTLYFPSMSIDELNVMYPKSLSFSPLTATLLVLVLIRFTFCVLHNSLFVW